MKYFRVCALALILVSGLVSSVVPTALAQFKDAARALSCYTKGENTHSGSPSCTSFSLLSSMTSTVSTFVKTLGAFSMSLKTGENPQTNNTGAYLVSLVPDGNESIQAGKPVQMTIVLKDSEGQVVKDLEIVHEKVLHLLAVSEDLSWFSHQHPSRRDDGSFVQSMTFPSGGKHRLYFDFTPKGLPQQVVWAEVTSGGALKPAVPLSVDADLPKSVDGFTITFQSQEVIKVGDPLQLSFTINKDNMPVTSLQAYLGALGHLVIISQDGTQFVHAHPQEGNSGGHDQHAGHAKPVTIASPQTGGPRVNFEAHFKTPGIYKAWGQFNVGTVQKEQILTVPFTFTVAKGDNAAASQEVYAPDHSNGSKHKHESHKHH